MTNFSDKIRSLNLSAKACPTRKRQDINTSTQAVNLPDGIVPKLDKEKLEEVDYDKINQDVKQGKYNDNTVLRKILETHYEKTNDPEVKENCRENLNKLI